MQGLKRRIVYVSSYEIIGMVISSVGLALLAGDSVEHTGPLSVMITTIAVTWNFIYNILYEKWEARQKNKSRTVKRRIAHAIGFQITLVMFLIPLIGWWMDISLVAAFWLDVAFIIIIPIYTFIFNWTFDKLFGLPASAQVNTVQE
ncbi:PACE efflux transporter [Acinetobacter nosocomialis]|uniref:PACE efflux transporter n=1 Tax=Acinetobacter nosocomialis TaxID=106654 RepID=UPI000B3DB155|nr:PACE efflux transporter [Acinetobacter nosocomialis]MBD0446038.1 PACE efflux transporter [Acinetobacter nosocomialis]MBO8213321.1 PACE efflux transporter [Acinetobacter nosocomialis]MDE3321391.1 PACE efflux transporter [Acinetobacter nosocomialis]MDQ9039192.1 PACE efflux transporter [Acinetobacter nosocomialis]MDR9532129.1 PACE efflux transporter [Acinetobacter nosocomialis]